MNTTPAAVHGAAVRAVEAAEIALKAARAAAEIAEAAMIKHTEAEIAKQNEDPRPA